MRDSILNFSKQFSWEPRVENSEKLSTVGQFWVCGMGGSHLSADILRLWHPELPLRIHSDYGLPYTPKDSLLVFSSYSGNTEEIIDGLNKAIEANLSAAVIASGGELLDIAKRNNLPFIQLPSENIQPRMALGYSLRALLAVMKEDDLLKETDTLVGSLASKDQALQGWEAQGKEMADRLADSVPVIYASVANWAIAKIWKIKINETAKIPAFYNTIPELNHNEMEGLGVNSNSEHLVKSMYFILINDSEDRPENAKRMEVLEKLLQKKGLNSMTISISGSERLERIFKSVLLADWVALYLAEYYGNDPGEVPLVEEFKDLLR